jgi:hypothetical protein
MGKEPASIARKCQRPRRSSGAMGKDGGDMLRANRSRLEQPSCAGR